MPDHSAWYETPDDLLSQGDILRSVDVYRHDYAPESARPKFQVASVDVVVLTQTCDIPKASQQTVLLAQVDSYDYVVSRRGAGQDKPNWRKRLLESGAVADFLLPPCPTIQLGWSFVNFRELFVLPKFEFDGDHLPSRLRAAIASPYREHLSQAYARFVMRVGLPDTLRDFVDHVPPRAG